MEIKIQAIRFNATEQLAQFIEKKVGKLDRCLEQAKAEVILKVVKPETAMNKEVNITLTAPAGGQLRAEKICDSFEEAINQCVDTLQRQSEKFKEKQRTK